MHPTRNEISSKVGNKEKSLSVIVPVFNNNPTLFQLHKELCSILGDGTIPKAEIVFVDDGSQDASFCTLLQIKQDSPVPVRVVKLAGNFGQVNAISAGVQESREDLVACISADLQDPPEIIREMYLAQNQDFKIVIAERTSRDDGIIATLSSRVVYSLLRLVSRNVPKGGFDCWLIDSQIAEYVIFRKNRFAMRQVNFVDSGISFTKIQYHRRKRNQGKSGWNLQSKLRAFTEVISLTIGSLAKHLVLLGVAISMISLFTFVSIVIGYFNGKSPFQGFTFLVGLMTLFGAFQLIIIGATLTILVGLSENPHQKNFVIEEIH